MNLEARGSRLAARGSRLAARGSRLTAHGSRLTAHGRDGAMERMKVGPRVGTVSTAHRHS
ncbi:hypothetical protein DPR02_11450 [Burkholderia cepacia]|uniref:Uncharacterized protein n=1 Tax=Burkholderia cepacia TaxID=292 RepID=A0AAQ0JKG7_BURCE|nr:hypothetical protein DPR02_11450 [Burkholderia cepacia]